MVYFSTTGTYGDNPTKHSRRNAEETGEFVVNMVSADLAEQMNITTTMADYGVDEMKLAGLAPAPSRYVKPPRVAKSPIALECKYWKTIELPEEPGHEAKRGSIVLGQVVEGIAALVKLVEVLDDFLLHLLETARQLAQFISAAQRQRADGAVFGEALDGVHHVVQRPGQGAGSQG